MFNRSKIEEVVYRAIDKVNELLLDENTLTKEGTTILVGEGSSLDSMGFVNFIVALEDELAQEIGINLNIVEALNDAGVKVKPWFNVGDLINILCGLSQAKQMRSVERPSS